MIFPNGLRPGDKIALIAPSSPAKEEDMVKAKGQLEAWGFQVVLGESCYVRSGYLAGDDFSRAQEINQFFADQRIGGILCLRGGYGLLRILPLLKEDLIRQNPKVLIGFSDITLLHLFLQQRCQMVSFHGPMGVQLAQGLDPFSQTMLLKAITQPGAPGDLLAEQRKPPMVLLPGIAQGRLVGGNLATLLTTLGTAYEIDTRDKILFLEEINEPLYRVDRMLTQLGLAGKLSGVAGILLGDFRHPGISSEAWQQLLLERLSPYGKPVLWGIEAGHCMPNLTLPLGAWARLSTHPPSLEILKGAGAP